MLVDPVCAAALRLGHLARRASQGNDPLSTLERLISDLCTSQTTRPENGHLHVERQSSRTGTGGRTQPRRRMQRRKGSGAGIREAVEAQTDGIQ